MSKAIDAINQPFPVYEIPVSKLEKSPQNARKTYANAALQELKASILAHGLMQNLVVTEGKKGRHYVIAGARRLAALESLMADGSLPADHAVLCQVVDENRALELSIAENTVREAMHPADEYEAFAKLSDGGLTADQIAQRFGTDEKHVLKRLKLGRVAPELLAEYRAGELSLDVLMAYAVTDDKERQLEAFKSLQGWQRENVRHIRDTLTESLVSGKSKLARFVGQEAYEAAGGRTKTDLFGDEVFFEDSALLQRLAGEKLEAEAEKLRAEGWGWVEMDFECDYSEIHRHGRIKPQPLNAPADLKAELEAAEAEVERLGKLLDEAYGSDDDNQDEIDRLDAEKDAADEKVSEIEERLEAFIDFDPEQKQLAGCFVSINGRGELSIEKGLVKPESKRAVANLTASGENDDEDERPAEKPKGLPESLKRDLEAYRLGAAQAEIAKHPAIAFDLLVFKTAKSLLSHSAARDGANIGFHRDYGGFAGKDAKAFVSDQMEPIAEALPVAWLEASTEAEQFALLQALEPEQKHALLAFCVACTLQPKLSPAEGKPLTAYDIALSQTGANVADYWRPNAANFLSRITREALLEIGQEIFGGNFATQYAQAKKGELVAQLDKGFANPEKALDPEKVRRLSSWLPAGMAFPAITHDEPAEKPAKAKKGKKAA